MEKKILPSYFPSRIVFGQTRTYILVYDRGRRYRPTFKLNYIKDKNARVIRAEEIKEKIDWWLKGGNAFVDLS